MVKPQTVGQYRLQQILGDFYIPGMEINKRSIKEILGKVAAERPEDYADIADKMMRLGRDTGEGTGGGSFSISDLKTPKGAEIRRLKLQAEIQEVLADAPPSMQNELITKILAKAQKDDPQQTFDEVNKNNNPLATIVKGAGRGNNASLARLVSSDLMYADNAGKPIAVPVLRSYSQGLTPGEFIASTFGARKGLNEAKLSVASGGYMAKLIANAAHRVVVTGDDGRDDSEALDRGLPVDTDDDDNVGALLARDTAGYKRNTVLTPKILQQLKKKGQDEILVRSPITTADPDGGVYAKDVGHREGDRLPEVGSAIGITAGQAISEPVTQSVLSAKHKGGLAEEDKGLSGFDLVDRLFNTPKDFRESATYAEADGSVEDVFAAPQGGNYVKVSGTDYFVPRGVKVTVKKGDVVEAGDTLSAGVINPRKLIQHKGLGEGARQFTLALRSAIKDSGLYSNRRNIELVAKGLVNRVRIDEEFGDYAPGDLVPYNEVAAVYQPRAEAKETGLQSVAGKYLEKPVLHYTIGTRVTPSVVKKLEKHGIKRITTHSERPQFSSEMVPATQLLKSDSDWMTRQTGTGLTKGLLDATHKGLESDQKGTSFVASRAMGLNFNDPRNKVHLPTPGAKREMFNLGHM